jgi:ATPase subunit of ABC transporter with duplicated ATPase domains
MIVGEESADDGDVSVPKKITIGYFRQDIEEMSGRSVLDEAIAGSGRLGDLHHELEALQNAMSDPDRLDEMDRRTTPTSAATSSKRAPARFSTVSASRTTASTAMLVPSAAAGRCAWPWPRFSWADPTCC